MKITCNRQDLLASITGVSRAVSSKSSIPSIEGILFECDDTKLKLTAYDLEIGIITYAAADVIDTGSIIINARLLMDILRKSDGENVTIESDDSLRVRIQSGITKYSFIGISPSDFPELPMPATDSSLSIPGQDVKDLIDKTIYAVSTNDQRPVHTGSKFILKDGTLTVVSVDGHRLAVAKKEGLGSDVDASFIVPAKTLQELSKLIGDKEENIRISTARRYAIFHLVGYTVVTRLLEGDFIDYKASVPQSYKTVVTVKAGDLMDAVDRTSLLISDRFKSPIRLQIGSEEMKVSCTTALGSVHDAIPCTCEGDPLEIGFNYRYVLDALRNGGVAEVKLMMNEPTRPMTIVPVEGDDFLYLILPVMLRSYE